MKGGLYSLAYGLARGPLFALDAEQAHELTIASLRRAPRLAGLFAPKVPDLPVTVMGLDFPNPVGLAAGLDKNGECIDAFAAMGFGFIEVGTVTPRPQPGNPRPRLFRLPEHEALINRLGFNNHGVDALINNVRRSRYKGVLGINIGKNFDTPVERAADDYRECLRKVYAHASYITVNISSPNTAGLRNLQGSDALDALLTELIQERQTQADMHGRLVPLVVKIAPDLTVEEVQQIADLLVRHRIDGVIATNTTLARDAVAGHPHADEVGGLSGRPLNEQARGVLEKLAARLQGEVPIIGVGGIGGGAEACARISAGASLLQIYTGFIYQGPVLVRDCVKAIAAGRAV